MHRGQILVAVTEVVLAELRGGIAVVLQQLGDRRVLMTQTQFGAGQTDLGQPGAERNLTGDESGATRGAALFGVVVGEQSTFVGDAVDVGRFVTHHAAAVGADIGDTDIIAPDHEDVRLAPARAGAARSRRRLGLGHLDRVGRCLLARIRLLGLAAGREQDRREERKRESPRFVSVCCLESHGGSPSEMGFSGCLRSRGPAGCLERSQNRRQLSRHRLRPLGSRTVAKMRLRIRFRCIWGLQARSSWMNR